MKRINHNQIIVPLEFKVACVIYKVDIVVVLQVFIDHITLYDTISTDYHEGFTEATRTMGDYIRSKRKYAVQSKGMKNCNALVMSYITKIGILANKKSGLTNMKREKTRPLVNMIFKAMARIYTISDILYIDEYSVLKLSKDFCVLCEFHNCYPKELLEHFMGRISAANAHARKALKLASENFTFSLFTNIADGFGRDNSEISELSELEIDFFERLEDLHLELYIIRDLDNRENIIRDIYLSHYQATTQN